MNQEVGSPLVRVIIHRSFLFILNASYLYDCLTADRVLCSVGPILSDVIAFKALSNHAAFTQCGNARFSLPSGNIRTHGQVTFGQVTFGQVTFVVIDTKSLL